MSRHTVIGILRRGIDETLDVLATTVLRNKTCDQLYGRDASQEVSVGEKVSPQHTPSPLYISGSPTMQ
jgi:hypothetical protein